MKLSEFCSKDDAEEAETGSLIPANGTVKIKKSKVESKMLTTPEQLRRKVMLWGHHIIFTKLRYPDKAAQFNELTPFTFTLHANWLLGEEVAEFETKGSEHSGISRPEFAQVVAYEFQIRKALSKRLNAREHFVKALEAVRRDMPLRERHFTTPTGVTAVARAMDKMKHDELLQRPRRVLPPHL